MNLAMAEDVDLSFESDEGYGEMKVRFNPVVEVIEFVAMSPECNNESKEPNPSPQENQMEAKPLDGLNEKAGDSAGGREDDNRRDDDSDAEGNVAAGGGKRNLLPSDTTSRGNDEENGEQ